MQFRLAVAALVVIACDRGTPQPARDSTGLALDTVGNPPPVSAIPAKCPATGIWSECAVFERLDRSGLAPRRDSAARSVTEPPLSATGTQLRVGNSELEIYLYPDGAARETDERKLDRKKYVEYTASLALESQPTLIHSVNLLAILHSRNDHLRERVGDALTAGPPQPSTSK